MYIAIVTAMTGGGGGGAASLLYRSLIKNHGGIVPINGTYKAFVVKKDSFPQLASVGVGLVFKARHSVFYKRCNNQWMTWILLMT